MLAIFFSHTPLLHTQQLAKIHYFPSGTGKLLLKPIPKKVTYKVRIKGSSHYKRLQFQVNKGLGSEPSMENRFIKLFLKPNEYHFDHYYYFKDGPGVYQITIWGESGKNNTFISLCTFNCVTTGDLPRKILEFSINKQIISYLDTVMGKTVGKGECWDLAQMALDKNSADWQRTLQFGIPINPEKDTILPGDIIQMSNVKLKKGRKIEYFGIPKHTAIVYEVLSNKNFIIAHQNVYKRKFVLKSEFNLRNIESGEVQFFRPQAGLIKARK